MNPIEILDYEVRSSWWAHRISNAFLQSLAGHWFAWKVRTKLNRYRNNLPK